MQRKSVKRLWKWARIIILVYIVIGLVLYFFQEKILFQSDKLPPNYVFNFPIPFKEINLAVTAEKNINIIRFTVPDSLCKGIVLYFHGNRKNIERYAPFASNFTKNNYEVWMMDYPGYGKSTGKRNEQVLYDDALLVYRMARTSYSRDSIIIYGRSLGTGIAAQLASVRDCKRLILEAPYYSIDALASHYAPLYPAGLMCKYHLPTYRYLQKVDAPVTLLHGTDDTEVPYKNSKRLMKVAKPGSELVTIEGAQHNNLNDFPLFHQKLDSVLQLPRK
ncbi:MAG TPA: alpha/beta fold hydrolase [Chitinophagaceae bacterium]|nr:alpha/beta fold hydrolase [Chitinophagaceae bacterium]